MIGRLIRGNVKKLQNLPNTWLGGKSLGVVHLTRGRAPLPPMYVELALTYRCNLTCAYCYQASSRRTSYPDMTLDDIRAIDANLSSSFRIRPRLYLFGGEPTLNGEFGEILGYLDRRGYRLSMTTNGTLLGPHLDLLARCRRIDNLVVSLNAGNLEGAPRVVRDLTARMRSGSSVSVNCPADLATETGRPLVDLVRIVDDCGAKFVSVQHSQSVFMDKQAVDAAKQVAQIRETARESFRTPVTFFPDIRDADLEAYYTDTSFPRSTRSCVLPWFDVFVRPNGDVVPCDEMDVVMGNVRQEKMSAIWNNARYRAFRRGIHKRGLTHGICQRCCHRQYYG